MRLVVIDGGPFSDSCHFCFDTGQDPLVRPSHVPSNRLAAHSSLKAHKPSKHVPDKHGHIEDGLVPAEDVVSSVALVEAAHELVDGKH